MVNQLYPTPNMYFYLIMILNCFSVSPSFDIDIVSNCHTIILLWYDLVEFNTQMFATVEELNIDIWNYNGNQCIYNKCLNKHAILIMF